MKSLDDYMADLPPTYAENHGDGIADSSSDASDIDEPKAITETPSRPGGRGGVQLAGSSRPGAYQARPHSMINPGIKRNSLLQVPQSQIKEQSSSPEDLYYAVQWCVVRSQGRPDQR